MKRQVFGNLWKILFSKPPTRAQRVMAWYKAALLRIDQELVDAMYAVDAIKYDGDDKLPLEDEKIKNQLWSKEKERLYRYEELYMLLNSAGREEELWARVRAYEKSLRGRPVKAAKTGAARPGKPVPSKKSQKSKKPKFSKFRIEDLLYAYHTKEAAGR